MTLHVGALFAPPANVMEYNRSIPPKKNNASPMWWQMPPFWGGGLHSARSYLLKKMRIQTKTVKYMVFKVLGLQMRYDSGRGKGTDANQSARNIEDVLPKLPASWKKGEQKYSQ